ncbi:hypothetical protein FACS1894214_3060 [Planctomycetales bacterium]|nr:hypothetical protein FACS1894214_3030 [Planctomycetales bacterium]GHT31605.1 hypothetical protein FACS1894214_3060 [Planctomycetales bacterium]
MQKDELELKWHPAFFEAIQFELDDYRYALEFEAEHPLTAEPLKIDVVIIKKIQNIVIEKNIGRIFRRINVVEYKSPDDYISASGYKKVQSYAWLYASQNGVKIADITISVVARTLPKALFKELTQTHRIVKAEPGIYTVEGSEIASQIVVESELSPATNLWLTSLRKDILAQQELLEVYRNIRRFGEDAESGAYLDIVSRVNKETLERFDMGEMFIQVMRETGYADFFAAEGKAEGQAEGETKGKVEAVLEVLQSRFKTVPKNVQNSIRSYTDLTALRSLLVSAATCQTINEFKEHLVK